MIVIAKIHSLIGYLVVACAFSGGSAAEGLAGSDRDLPVKKWLDVTFAEHATGPLLLDVFRPDDDELRPAVLCLHGGFWAKGSKKFMHPLAEDLADRGYVAISSNYRLSGVAPAPAQLHDVQAAIRYLREHADEYGIDPGKIGVTGSSAGGYLAVMAAVVNHGDPLSRPNAAVGMGAQTDLSSPHIQNTPAENWAKFMGGFFHQVPANYTAQSPIAHLSADDPPVAIVCGEHDRPSTRAVAFRHRAFRLGVPTDLTEISGAPHGLLLAADHRLLAVDTLDDFFDLYLGHGKTGAVSLVLEAEQIDKSPTPLRGHWIRLGGGYHGCEGAQWATFSGGAGEKNTELIYAAHHDGLVFRWNEERGLRLWLESTPETSTIRPARVGKGSFYAVEQTTRRLVSLSMEGEVVGVLADRLGDKRINRPNDLRVHPTDGSVWITDPNFLYRKRPLETQELPGQYVLRYDPDTNELTAPIKSLTLPNGIAFDRSGRRLFIGDSKQRKLFRFMLNERGEVSDAPEPVAAFPKGLDGVSLDPRGNPWVAEPDGVMIISQSGKEIAHLPFPDPATSIDFIADDSGDFHWVAVTTRKAAHVATFKF